MGQTRVLFVDDDGETRRTMQEVLEFEGYDVVLAASGGEAIDILHQQEFRLVLLDVLMPGIDGIGVLKEIKQTSPSTRVIMITGVDDDTVVACALDEGAEAVFRKPLDIGIFLPLLMD